MLLTIRLTEGFRSICTISTTLRAGGIQSECNCRIFSADHTLHILRADIYVGIMFGMLMCLSALPLPLFRFALTAQFLLSIL